MAPSRAAVRSESVAPVGFAVAIRRSLLPILGGILIGSYLGSLLLAAFLQMSDGTPLQRWLQVPLDAFGLSFYALLAGVPVALVFGLPVYAWLLSRGWVNWLTVAVMALVPAVLALPGGIMIGGVVAMYALCVAWITHALQLWFSRTLAASRAA